MDRATKDLPGPQYPGTESRYGTRLRWARTAAQQTQADLASGAGCQQSNVSKLERTAAGGSQWTVHFARHLGIDAWWLATGNGSPLRAAQ